MIGIRWMLNIRVKRRTVEAVFIWIYFYKSMKSQKDKLSDCNAQIRSSWVATVTQGGGDEKGRTCTEDHDCRGVLFPTEKNMKSRSLRRLCFFLLIYLLQSHWRALMADCSMLRLIFYQPIYVMLSATIRIRHLKHVCDAK